MVSQFAPGARLWMCGDERLDLVIDGELEPLAEGVDCSLIRTSEMHSELVFASEGSNWRDVFHVDTDSQTVTHRHRRLQIR